MGVVNNKKKTFSTSNSVPETNTGIHISLHCLCLFSSSSQLVVERINVTTDSQKHYIASYMLNFTAYADIKCSTML